MSPANVRNSVSICPLIGLGLLCLTIVSGCSSSPRTVYQPILPPQNLLADNPGPDWTPTTNGELIQWAIETDKALSKCRTDKTALRNYVQNLQTGLPDGGSD